MGQKAGKTARAANVGYVVGREGFAKISAVERIHVSPKMIGEFRSFDKGGLTAPERRRILSEKYGKPR